MDIQKTNLQIVIIDNNEILRKALASALLTLEYQVSLTANGRVGLEIARVSRPDLIITNGQMPRLSGPEVVRSLQANGFSGKIIGLSQFPEIIQQFKDLNVPTLQKPYRLAELIKLINELFPVKLS